MLYTISLREDSVAGHKNTLSLDESTYRREKEGEERRRRIDGRVNDVRRTSTNFTMYNNHSARVSRFRDWRAHTELARGQQHVEVEFFSDFTDGRRRCKSRKAHRTQIAQRRDSFALFTQSPLFHCPSRALFPYHFDRDASPRRHSTNQSSAFLRDVIP